MPATASFPIACFRGAYAFLSNFYPSPIELAGGYVAATVEHGFQATKVLRYEDFIAVLQAPTPQEAKRLGRRAALRPEWEEVKLSVMRSLLCTKFARDSELGARLLATGNALLSEGNTWGDEFWGVYRGHGANWLGHLLMARRAELHGSAT